MKKEDLIKDVEVQPFNDIIYNTPEDKEIWETKIQSAAKLFHNLEYETVKQKKRKCATIHIRPRNYDKVIEQIMEDDLYWFPIQRSKSYTGFSHKHFPVNEIDMNTTVYGVLSYDKKYANQFKTASEQPVDHETIGALLGFPSCCREFFTEAWLNFKDPMYQIAKNSAKIEKDNYLKTTMYMEAQQLMRYKGFRITSHLPCSFDCSKTRERAKIWKETAEEKYPVMYKNLKEILLLPGRASINNGIIIVETDHFKLLANSLATKEEFIIEWDEVKIQE